MRTYLPKDHPDKAKEIGSEETLEEYLAKIVTVFREVRRVLRPDGVLWLNMGDLYARRAGQDADHEVDTGMRTGRNGHSLDLFQPGLHNPPAGFKPKDLIGLPWRVAFALQADGWWLRKDNVWEKDNPIPESCDDRCTSSHEYVFQLTKNGANPLFWTHPRKRGRRDRKPKPDFVWINRQTHEILDYNPSPRSHRWYRKNLWEGHDYFFDYDAISEPAKESTVARITEKNILGQRGGEKSRIYGREMHHCRNPRKISQDLARKQDALGKNTYTGFNDRYVPQLRRRKRDVWHISTEPFPKAHFATFPMRLVEPCVLSSSSAKGVCPICGAPLHPVLEEFIAGPRYRQMGPKTGQHPVETPEQGGKFRERYMVGRRVIRWLPTCDHKWWPQTGVRPATVLDLFGGSGRTSRVARDNGRDSIYIDLFEDYADMAIQDLLDHETKAMFCHWQYVKRVLHPKEAEAIG
jgi:DNA modification methylase